jgi:hypothetical protein
LDDVVEVDAHLAMYKSKEGGILLAYGSRLFNAKHGNDAELKKLWFLFRLLETFRVRYERDNMKKLARIHAKSSIFYVSEPVKPTRPPVSIVWEPRSASLFDTNTIDLAAYIANMDLRGETSPRWLNTHFLTNLATRKLRLRVHLLDNEKQLQEEAYQLIRPCVEDYYQRHDFSLDMLDAAYFVLTLSKVQLGLNACV